MALEKILGSKISTSLVTGAAAVMAAKIVAAGLGFSVHMLFTRKLGVVEYGNYAYLLTWVLLLGAFAQLGFKNSLVRLIPMYVFDDNQSKLKGLISSSMGFVLITSLLISLLFGIFATGVRIFSELSVYAIYASLVLLPIYSIILLAQGGLQGACRPLAGQLPWPVLTPLFTIVIIFIHVEVLGLGINSELAMAYTVLAAVLSLVITAYWVNEAIYKPLWSKPSEYDVKYWLLISIPLMFSSGMEVMLRQVDTVMVGSLVNTANAGIYSISSKVTDVVTLGLMAMNTVAAPYISRCYVSKDFASLRRIARLSASAGFIVTLLAVAFVGIFGEWILGLFGKEFTSGYFALLILLAGQVINAAAGPVGVVMVMTGEQNKLVKILGVAAVINLVLNILFIPQWGMEGAAMATGITIVIWNLWMLKYINTKLDLNCSIIPESK